MTNPELKEGDQAPAIHLEDDKGDPFDLASLDLMASDQPPAFLSGGTWTYPLGTDNQARDVLSAILYGARISILVGVTAIVLPHGHQCLCQPITSRADLP